MFIDVICNLFSFIPPLSSLHGKKFRFYFRFLPVFLLFQFTHCVDVSISRFVSSVIFREINESR